MFPDFNAYTTVEQTIRPTGWSEYVSHGLLLSVVCSRRTRVRCISNMADGVSCSSELIRRDLF